MSNLKFNVVKESQAPSPTRHNSTRDELKPLFNALEHMKSDEVLLITFEDHKHYNRTAAMVRSYFGNGSYSFRKVSKKEQKFIIKPKTKNDK